MSPAAKSNRCPILDSTTEWNEYKYQTEQALRKDGTWMVVTSTTAALLVKKYPLYSVAKARVQAAQKGNENPSSIDLSTYTQYHIDEEKYESLNCKAMGTIQEHLGTSVRHHMEGITSAKELWDTLLKLFDVKDTASTAKLMKDFLLRQHRPGELVEDYIADMVSMYYTLKKVTIQDEIAFHILAKVNPSLATTREILLQSEMKELTLAKVQAYLRNGQDSSVVHVKDDSALLASSFEKKMANPRGASIANRRTIGRRSAL
jgi:gag-polypeptide of LTR copia-type